MKTAFIGLGVMGFPMAGHLTRAGHEVTVYNRTIAKAQSWTGRYGGRIAETPAAAAAQAEIVFTCVTNDAALRDVVCRADGILAGIRPGSILVDHTSASPAIARELAQTAAKQGVHFLDAPVTGGEPGAIAGKLGIMVGGPEDILRRAEPALLSYARMISLMGPVGSGHISKMVNVICAAGMGQAIAEGLAFAVKAGLDIPALMTILAQGSSQSWVLEHKGPKMVERDYKQASFTVDLILKDIGATLAEAEALGAELPLLAFLNERYGRIQKSGGGQWDTASLIDPLL